MNWLDEVKWDAQGLVPVIAQENSTGDVLMFAWMNREALQKTAELGRAVYFSRSRGKLWFKGEESGHVQTVHDIRLRLAAQGLPKGGLVGFEVMENQRLGVSQFLEQINFQRALEGELSRTVRSAHNNGERPFEEPPFQDLLAHAALRDNAPFRNIINKAHHHLHEVTPHEAGEVAEPFKEIDRLLRSCSASYARFMGRLTREDNDLYLASLPQAPSRVALNKAPIPLLGEVSARSHANRLAATAVSEVFDFGVLGDIALYGVRSPGLGALALQGQVVAVSLDREARDGDPVIALNGDKVYCRRFLGDTCDPSRIALACDRTGTERVAPTLLLPAAKTRLMPIVGVLYEQERFEGREEACRVETSGLLDRKLVAVRVSDDSAYPVIRHGDIAVLEAVESPTEDEIARLEDRIVVAVLGSEGESFAYLKRLGSQVSPGVRILENVGMKGRALAVATSALENLPGIGTLQKLWRVHGMFRLGALPLV